MRPVDDRNFSHLLGTIYDAATRPEGWREVLAQLPNFARTTVLDFVELQLTTAAQVRPVAWQVVQYATHGLSPEAERALMTDWAYRIPLTYDLIDLTLRRQRAIATPEQTSPDFDFERSAFYQECAAPNDFRYMLGVSGASPDRGSLFILALNRPKRYGEFSNADAKLVRALLPHLCRAQQIGQQLRDMNLVQGLQGAALDHCAAPVLGLNVRGTLLYANAAAEALLQAGTVLRRHGGSVQATRPAEHQALMQALRRASRLGHAVEGRPEEHLTFARDGLPALGGTLLPVHPERGFTLLLRDPAARRTPPLILLQHLYGLTPAEARVAALLSGGLNLDEIAAQLGTATGTVRNQLKQVFAKMGVRRQGDLIRLTLNLS